MLMTRSVRGLLSPKKYKENIQKNLEDQFSETEKVDNENDFLMGGMSSLFDVEITIILI